MFLLLRALPLQALLPEVLLPCYPHRLVLLRQVLPLQVFLLWVCLPSGLRLQALQSGRLLLFLRFLLFFLLQLLPREHQEIQ